MSTFFLIGAILLPLAGGVAIIPIRFKNDRARAIYCEAVACLTSLFVWITISREVTAPVTIYSFTHGFSISFFADGVGRIFAGMVSVMWPLVLLYAFEYMEAAQRKNPFFAFYVMTYGITLGVAFAANATTLYVFFEMLTLVTIPLVVHYNDHESLYAGRKYAAYTIGGASLAFFSVVLSTVYGQSGFFTWGGSMSSRSVSLTLMQVAFLFAFFGFGAKAAVFPLHDWLPTASAAPTPVTALLHAVAVVNSGVFAVMRMAWYIFGPAVLRGSVVHRVCLGTACFSLVFGAVMALKEKHFKRRLAYSTMSNLSYMLAGVMLLTVDGLKGSIAHMLFHGIIKMSLFLCAGAFMHQTGSSYVFEINGVGKKMPTTFTCYTIGALSLTGIPPLCGFVSKWQLLMAGASEGTAWGVAADFALIIAAFLCAIYTLTVSIRAFFPMKGTDRYGAGSAGEAVKEAGWRMLTPIVFFTIVDVVFGVCSGPVMNLIGQIAQGVL